MSRSSWLVVIFLTISLISFPPHWYPYSLRVTLTDWIGVPEYRALPVSIPPAPLDAEKFCPEDLHLWRQKLIIDGVEVRAETTCVADNPYLVAAAVKGTNNVSHGTLQASGFTNDAITKGEDLDGDGDPDEIHIRLEVVELNGGSNVVTSPATQYSIAPGIFPSLWVFAPKLGGMAVENFESQKARLGLRLPAPAIRVEQGDRVIITLENTHYMPHTLHLHGADHQFLDSTGEGNDGVPITSEKPVLPGFSRSYELTPRQSGTMFYHCHVQTHVHAMMGLQGLFIVEPNKPNNWLQTLNLGAGLVRAPSVASKEQYDHEYDIHYQDLDSDLVRRVRDSNDPRLITKSMHRDYDITDATADYFLLNGRSFPYTFRESLVVVEDGDRIKLRVVNGGMKAIALHTHGHKFTVTHRDGVAIPKPLRHPQDVVALATSQRVDVVIEMKNDGLHSYGPGIWPFHDHQYQGITTDGIGPGGNISAIVYEQYLGEDGWPKTNGVAFDRYFSAAFYRKEIPVWETYGANFFSDTAVDGWLLGRILICLVSFLFALIFFSAKVRSRFKKNRFE
jgi:hypothetical protein